MEAILFTDGACRGNGKNNSKSGAGAVLFYNNEMYKFKEYLGIGKTNNIAEFEGLLLGLRESIKLKVRNISIHMDSKLICKQITGEYKAKNEILKQLRNQVLECFKYFDSWKIMNIPRKENTIADELANSAIDEQ